MRKILSLLLIALLSSTITAQDTDAENCITIIGDSLPAAAFVAQLPGTGVTVLQGERLSYLLDDALQAADLLHYGIYDLSLGASSLAAPDNEPYLFSRELFVGQALNCRFVVIFPFLNDLYASDDTETGITDYTVAIRSLLTTLREDSPNSHLILMDFYTTTLGGAGGATYGEDVTPLHVATLNAIHAAICNDDFKITCFDTETTLNPIAESLLREIDQTTYADAQYNPLNPDDQTMIDAFWQSFPNRPILGDGLHINPNGQQQIIAALMQRFTELDPLNFAPILQ